MRSTMPFGLRSPTLTVLIRKQISNLSVAAVASALLLAATVMASQPSVASTVDTVDLGTLPNSPVSYMVSVSGKRSVAGGFSAKGVINSSGATADGVKTGSGIPNQFDYDFSVTSAKTFSLNLTALSPAVVTGSEVTLLLNGVAVKTGSDTATVAGNLVTLATGLSAGDYDLQVEFPSGLPKNSSFSGQITVSAVPLPGSLGLLGTVIAAIGAFARRGPKGHSA